MGERGRIQESATGVWPKGEIAKAGARVTPGPSRRVTHFSRLVLPSWSPLLGVSEWSPFSPSTEYVCGADSVTSKSK